MVKLRNPWALEEYAGPYSDSSDDWTQALLNQTGHELADDGYFYVKIEDFPANFESVTIAKGAEGKHRTSFAKLADDEVFDQTELWSDDDTLYNWYWFKLSTEVEQDVQISLYTYNDL